MSMGLLLLGQKTGRRRGALHIIRFVEALSMCMSEGSSSTDTSSPFTLLMLRDSLAFRSRGSLVSLTDGLDSLLVGSILDRNLS